MKRKKFNSFLALLLATTMAFGQPASAYAAEVETSPVEVSESIEETEEDVTEVVTEEATTGEKETEEVVTEETTIEEVVTEEITTEEAITEEATTKETVTEEKETEEVVTEETTTEETVTEEMTEGVTATKNAEKEAGFTTMTLSQKMVEEKAGLAEVTAAMADMESGEDYFEHEIVYFAENEEEANQIAECYDGILIEYEYGVAVAEIKATVKEAVEAAADLTFAIPAVYPNIVYKINDGWDTATNEAEVTDETEEVQLIDEVDVEHEVIEEESAELQLPSIDAGLYATAPNDKYFNEQWHHEVLNTVEAWNATKGKGVTVAVIDTGIDYTHPDLKNNIAGYTSTLTYATTQKDENGNEIIVRVPIEHDGRDDNGHGTHCAGIIAAAANNSVGVAGIAPEAQIYSVKVLNSSGSGSTADIMQGVISATLKDVDVISMSLGGYFWDAAFQKAVDDATNAGIVVVAAAGNDYTSQKSYPAAYNNVIAVAATDTYNDLVDFSNYGKWVDVAAPGYEILSTVPTNLTVDRITYEAAGYAYMSGTSMACPTVAGTVALMVANCDSSVRNLDSSVEATTITNKLLNSALSNGADSYWYGYKNKFLAQNGYDDPNMTYPLVDTEAATWSVKDVKLEKPFAKFTVQDPSEKNVVEAGAGHYLVLDTLTDHAKIYYTLNGKKPTAKKEYLYTGPIEMTCSGKVKVQAIAVLGNKTSKVYSETFTFDAKVVSLSSTCKDEMTVAIGKSIQLSVDVAPSYAKNKKLEWSSSDGLGNITVNKKTGKVSCKKGTEEGTTATITAKTTDGSNLKYEFTVRAVKGTVDTLTLNKNSLNMSYWADDKRVEMTDTQGQNYVSTFKLIPSNNSIKTDQYIYKSSNTKVATVDAEGNVTAMGKGKATITVMANDGSGKKATCKVTVVTPVLDIYMWSSTGYSEDSTYIPVATGCSVTMKTRVNYNSSYYLYVPTNKKLVWTSDNPQVSVKNGKITCDKNATPGTTATITATAQDNFGASKSITVYIADRITKLEYVDPDTGNTHRNSVSWIGPVGAWIFDLHNCYWADDGWTKVVTKNGTNKYWPYVSSSTSNKDVVYHHYNENIGDYVIFFTKPGKSKVTYTTRDGSNTKFTINFKVTED